MSLIEQLNDYNVPNDILEPVTYEYPGFTGDERLFNAIDDIITNGKSVCIHGDSDCDGVFAAKIWQTLFDRLHYKNYRVHEYKERSHVLTVESVSTIIRSRFNYVLIVDSSTNDMDNLKTFVKFGIIPIVIDHHVANYDLDSYPKECIIINTVIENRLLREDKFRLSGGALSFCLAGEYLKRCNKKWKDLSAYGLITLYSDCIDMTRKLNRGIYYMATSLPTEDLPIYVRHFMHNYDVFCRRFIEFSFAPKINALFRAEVLSVINKYLFKDNTPSEFDKLIKIIIAIHDNSRKLVNKAVDSIKRENLNNIVIANLSSASIPIHENKLYNYTGLVANELSGEYGKPSVVLCDTGTGIKASFRDLLSRNYLPKFKQFCNAAGHGAAFAINLNYMEYNNFMYCLREMIDKKFYILGVQENIELDAGDVTPNSLYLNDVARINEFTGIDIPPVVLLKRNNLKATKAYGNTYNYAYKWGDYKIDSKSLIPPGSIIKIKPVLTKNLKFVVLNRNVMI